MSIKFVNSEGTSTTVDAITHNGTTYYKVTYNGTVYCVTCSYSGSSSTSCNAKCTSNSNIGIGCGAVCTGSTASTMWCDSCTITASGGVYSIPGSETANEIAILKANLAWAKQQEIDMSSFIAETELELAKAEAKLGK